MRHARPRGRHALLAGALAAFTIGCGSSLSGDPSICADFFVDGGVAVDVQAQDLSSLAAALGTGVAPACSEGNDEGPVISMSLTDTDTRDYDGPIFYRGRSNRDPADCASFDPVGLTSNTGSPPTVEVCAPAAIFPEPSPGQELWLSMWSYWAAAVFGPQRGPLRLAAASVAAPYDDSSAAMLEHVLGIHVDAEPRCSYVAPEPPSSEGTSLYDLVFATTPPTRVQSKSITTVRIANQDRRVWSSGEGRGVWFVIF